MYLYGLTLYVTRRKIVRIISTMNGGHIARRLKETLFNMHLDILGFGDFIQLFLIFHGKLYFKVSTLLKL